MNFANISDAELAWFVSDPYLSDYLICRWTLNKLLPIMGMTKTEFFVRLVLSTLFFLGLSWLNANVPALGAVVTGALCVLGVIREVLMVKNLIAAFKERRAARSKAD